jgi:radical SAM protein with 4Fe4S-binding SPASM domain
VHSTPGLTNCPDVFDPREHAVVHPLTHTCSAGKTSMGILSNGDCVPCLELRGEEFLCGNLLKDSLQDVWSAAPMRRLRGAGPAGYTGDCSRCGLRWTCYSARCVAYHLTGSLLGDDVSCYLIQEHAVPARSSQGA